MVAKCCHSNVTDGSFVYCMHYLQCELLHPTHCNNMPDGSGLEAGQARPGQAREIRPDRPITS